MENMASTMMFRLMRIKPRGRNRARFPPLAKAYKPAMILVEDTSAGVALVRLAPARARHSAAAAARLVGADEFSPNAH